MSLLDKKGGVETTARQKTLAEMHNIMHRYNLDDIWRIKHTDVKRYTWRQKSPRVHCRLDYFLISRPVSDMTCKTDILPSVLSDHSPILVSLKCIPNPTQGPGLWKLNTVLLAEQEYIRKIKAKITDFNHEYEHMEDKNIKWEILKYEIRRLSISYSKDRKRKQKEHTEVLEGKLQTLER